MYTLLQDLRYGIRMLVKTPGVTIVAVLALALGIGANAAIFSGVSAFLFRSLPVPEPDQLVRLFEATEDRGTTGSFSYPDFADYCDQNSVFAGLVAEDLAQAALSTENQNDVIWGQFVSGNYFDVLQIKPALGRPFAPEEDRTPGTHAVVVISHRLWQRRFAADPNIVGKTIELNSRPYHVIGVAPDFFNGSNFGLALDFWVPMMMVEEMKRSSGLLGSRNSQWLTLLARLKPGVTQAQAQVEMSAITQRLNQTYPNYRASSTRGVVKSEIEGRWDEAAPVMKSGSAIAMTLVGLILLIACANVANLLLARAASRRKEIGVRLALGASRARLIRQLLTESMLLSALGGGFGLLLAYWITDLMQGFVPVLPYAIISDFFSLDARALWFTLVISLATGLVFGLAPALHASNPEIVPVLKGDANYSQKRGRRWFTLRNGLVVAQVALSLVVLVCGALFIKSFRNAQTMNPGFTTQGVLLISMNPELVGYDDEQTRTFYRRMLEQAVTVPGVEAASFARLLPLGDSSNSSGPILREGETLASGSAGRNIMNSVVTSGYFRTLQIPLLAGRDFDDPDHKEAARVIIVNERMAQMLWPGEDAVGKRIFIGTGSKSGPIEVVGVAKTGKYRNLAEDPRPYYYYPVSQRGPSGMTLIVRTSGDPAALVNPIRNEAQVIDRRIPLYGIKTMSEHMTWALWGPSMAATLALAFGVVALLLSAVGLYSVMAYVVSQRTRELGIRMALGANRRDVLKLIAIQGMKLASVGLVVGLGLALVLARVLASVLIGVSSYDIATFVVVPLLLALVALIACLIPARRATKVDPLVALRYE
ncbi:MAG TPA: ABC transporter permease [Pyrinomonadaceae bacterium]|nr:ABC transporter permease [Pyrinomonadaceae bacterium]